MIIVAIPENGKVIKDVSNFGGMQETVLQNYNENFKKLTIKGFNNFEGKTYNVWIS
jgi:hypothetical protein